MDVRDVFVANTWSTSNTNYGGRMAFDRAGFLYLTVGERQEPERAQKPGEHAGKVLRLRDDGSAPPDNPFAGRAGYLPEIYSLGHRSPQGLARASRDRRGVGERARAARRRRGQHHPAGTQLRLAARHVRHRLRRHQDQPTPTSRPDLEAPFMYWVPSIAISGLAFYTGDRFPAWKGSAFVGSMFAGRTRGTGHLQRITFTEGRPIQREPMLTELHQRIREVRQGPDGLLYLLTDEPNGALLKLEPAPEVPSSARGHGPRALLGARRGGEPRVLGGAGRRSREPRRSARAAEIVFPDVEVHLDAGERAGGSEGSVVNHVAFRVPSFAGVEAAGLTVARLQQFPGVGSVMSPDGERIELFEDAATNLTFTPDAGPATGIALRHDSPSGSPSPFTTSTCICPTPRRWPRPRRGTPPGSAACRASARSTTPWTCPA